MSKSDKDDLIHNFKKKSAPELIVQAVYVLGCGFNEEVA